MHYKAIVTIQSRISELQKKIEDLKKLDYKSESYAGYVFIQNDISNFKSEIEELTNTMKLLINLSKVKVIEKLSK